MNKKKTIRICPKCSSPDVSPDLSFASYAQGSFFNKHRCNKCGYSGEFFPVVDVEKEKGKKQK